MKQHRLLLNTLCKQVRDEAQAQSLSLTSSSAVAVSMVVAAFLLGDPLSSSSASGGPGAMLTSSSEHEARFASTSTSTQEDSKQVRPLLINVKDHDDNLSNQKTTSVYSPARVSSFNLFITLGAHLYQATPHCLTRGPICMYLRTYVCMSSGDTNNFKNAPSSDKWRTKVCNTAESEISRES